VPRPAIGLPLPIRDYKFARSGCKGKWGRMR
jgi:hypothetical protein